MLSKREKLLIRPWEDQRYKNHKRKVQSAKPAIDDSAPTQYSHVLNKMKKLQAEKERMYMIQKENVRLLQKLGDIMKTKRLTNFWQHPRPNFLNREKINFPRPKTCSGRLEIVSTLSLTPTTSSIGSRSYSASRCPTCSGRPVKRNQVIPEERIPWEPPRKSWNKKITSGIFQKHDCCETCC